MSIPPIVLVVDLEDDTPDASYEAALEEAGYWVARSSSAEAAVGDILDLRPDVVISDLSSAGSETEALVRTLKTTSAVRAVPLVIVQRADAVVEPLPELDAIDARLAKPVSPPALRNVVERVLVASRAVRRRRKLHRAVSPAVAELSTVDEARPPERETTSTERECPACGRLLEWVERRIVGGVEYDYFRWCQGGCGLYCFGVPTAQWLKLA